MVHTMSKPETFTKIYSQASNDTVIPTYEVREDKKQSGANDIESVIIIKGGANVAFSASNKHQRNTKWAITEVNEEQLEILKAHMGFMRRVKKGFITIGKEPLTLKSDKSAQKTESQMKASNPKATPAVGPVGE